MLRVVKCIAIDHDLTFLVAATVICVLASSAAVNLAARARRKKGVAKTAWLLLAAFAAGYGIWATHFIAMLGYKTGLANGYDLALTAVSALVAIAVMAGALHFAITARQRWWIAAAGAIGGVGIAAMHYTGMAAWHVAAVKMWDEAYVVASIVLGSGLAAAAFHVAFSQTNARRRFIGAGLLVLAIVALHFTAMSALTLQPDSTVDIAGSAQPTTWLAAAMAFATIALLVAVLIVSIVDEHLEGRTSKENARLQQLVEAIRASEGRARQLALIAETSSDTIVIVDHDTSKIVWANEVFANMAGLSPADMVGLTIEEVGLEVLSATPELAECLAAIERGERAFARLKVRTKSGIKHLEGTLRLAKDGEAGARQRIATFHDVTLRVGAEQRLRDSEERFQLAYRGSNDGIWDWQVKDDKLLLSPRGHELLGLTPDDPRIESMAQLSTLLHPEESKRVQDAMYGHLKHRAPYSVQHRIRMKDGSYRWFRARGQAIWTAESKPVRMAGSLSDVDDLVRARKDAEDSSKLKSQFLANMSHEIRTPMNGVMGMAQLLLKTPLDEKQRRYCDMLVASSKGLLTIINDILDLSKIESGLMKLNIDTVDMTGMLEEALSRVEGVAVQKNLKLRRTVEPQCAGLFEGDSPRIIQVMVNLLGNAIKFTEKGEVVLEVTPARTGVTRFAVRDSGPGIPADQLAIVFERFRQVDGSTTRKHGGTGLGLAISKELVELMGGRIGVESTVGVGSTFWFELPLHITRAGGQAQETAVDDRTGGVLQGLSILVAEDNVTNQIVVGEMLSLMGSKPVIVSDGKAAIDELEKRPFDVVLMDIHMPVMNGDVAIQRIRTSGRRYSDVPIIVVTASAMKGMDEYYLEIGADGYVPKPIEIAKLKEAIQGVFEKRRADAA